MSLNGTLVNLGGKTTHRDWCLNIIFRNENGYDDVHCFVRCEKVQESKLAEWCEAHMQAEKPILHCRQHELDRLANGKYDRKGMMRTPKKSL